MTVPRDPRAFEEPAPAVLLDPDVRTAAGTPVVIRVMVTNRAPEPRTIAITALGVDAAWLPRPSRSLRPVMPGASTVAELTLSPAAGTVPARYPLAVAVQALDPVSEQATSATAIAETVLVVNAPGQVEVEIKPADVTGMFGKRVTVFLRNRGPATESVQLEVHSPEAAELRLSDEIVDVPSGQTVPVPGRIRIERRLFGHRSRHTYTVDARGSGASQRAEGSVTTRAVLGANSSKAFVLLAVVTLWAGLALVFIPKLSNSIKDGQNKAADKAAAVQSQVINSAAPGSSGTNASGDGGSGGSGGSGGAGGSGGGSASGSSEGSARAASASGVQLNGTVTGQSPNSVNVAIRPTSLVDEAAEGATGVGVDTDSLRSIGKIWGNALPTIAPSTSAQSRSTVTSTDGAWSFGSVKSPGYYLLTFAKPGYQTQRYVVDAASADATQPLKVNLVPGQGSLNGRIRGPSGALGAAKITITDGVNTITTSSNSKGDLGSWSVSGLSTPGSYLVSVSKDGLSTESSIATLDAGGSSTVNLSLKVGVASLVGRVQGPDSLGSVVGLGGVKVTATNGRISRTASTVTLGSIAGNYTLPDLSPGTYSVTMQASGYLPQTQRVTIKKGQSKSVVNAALSSATAMVTGTVVASGGVGPVVGAGLTLTSATNSYKITSGSGGVFRMNGVAPGTYVLSAQYFGMTASYATVIAVAGQVVQVPTKALELSPEVPDYTSTRITGFVSDGANPSGTLCAGRAADCTIVFTLHNNNGKPVTVAPPKAKPLSSGPTAYTLSDVGNSLSPGLYQLTIAVVIKPGSPVNGYLPATVSVRVPLNGTAQAPQVDLFSSSTISGTISSQFDATNGGTITNCVWAVPLGDTNPPPTTCDPPKSSNCETFGRADRNVGTIGTDGGYAVARLCPGTYVMMIVVRNPDFVAPPVSPPPVKSVLEGSSAHFDGQIFRKGRIQFTLTAPDPATGNAPALVNTDLDAGSVCGSISMADRTTDSDGKLLVTGLNAGVYTCTLAARSGGLAVKGTSSLTNVPLDETVEVSLTLTATVAPFVGQVVTSWSGSQKPVGGVTVTISGITGYTNGAPNPPTQVQVTTNAAGCFAVSPDGASPAAPAVCAGAGAVPSVGLGLAVPLASFHIDAQVGYQSFDQAKVSIDSTKIQTLSINPDPVDFGGQLTLPNGVQVPDLSQTSITVPEFAPGSGKLTPQSDGAGHISWIDSIHGSQIVPGNYTIAVVADGFAPWNYSFECLPDEPCTPTFELVQLGSLTLTNLPDGALVTLMQNNAPLSGPQTASGGSMTFPGLLPTSKSQGTRPTYQVQLHAAGYVFQSSVPVTCSDAPDSSVIDIEPGGNRSCSINPTQAGALTGTVNGISSLAGSQTTSPLVGATVTATRCADPTADGAATCTPATTGNFGPFTATTNDDGAYTVTGTNQMQGLDDGPWLLSTQVDGYQPASVVVNVTAGTHTAPDLDLKITPISKFSVTVQDGNGDIQTDGITVTLLQNGTSIGSTSTASAAGTFDFVDVVPGSYSVQVTGQSIKPVTDLDVPVDLRHTTHKAFVTLAASAASGLIQGLQGSSPAVSPLDGVRVQFGKVTNGTFSVADGTDKKPMDTTTPSTGQPAGTFILTNVPDGTWAVQLSKNGYITQTVAAVNVSHLNAATVINQTLVRVTHNVNLAVTTADAEDDISGATGITLTSADDSAWTLTAQPVTTAGKTSTWAFNAVPFGNWKLSITLPSGHFGSLAATTGTAAVACSAGTDTTPVTCTSSSGAPLVVSGSGPPSNPVNAGYTLEEYQVGLSVLAVRLTSDPNAQAPGSVGLTVKAGATQVYSSPTFTVSTSTPAAPTDTFWGKAGTTYTATATVDPSVLNWAATAQTLNADAPSTPVSLKETGSSVTVTLTGPTIPASATGVVRTVTLVPPSGSGITAPAAFTVPAGSTTARFNGVPYASGWTASISGSYSLPAGGGGGGSTKYVLSGTSADFTISGPTVTASLPFTATPQ